MANSDARGNGVNRVDFQEYYVLLDEVKAGMFSTERVAFLTTGTSNKTVLQILTDETNILCGKDDTHYLRLLSISDIIVKSTIGVRVCDEPFSGGHWFMVPHENVKAIKEICGGA